MLDTLVYQGDHPGLRQEKNSYPVSLSKGKLYLELRSDTWVPLYPLMNVQYCPSCEIRETYFFDKWDGTETGAVLKSFERGHTHENDEESKKTASDLNYWLQSNFPKG